MTGEIFKGVNCCKGARKPHKFIRIEPRYYVCKPGEIVKLTLKNYYAECDPGCWEWDLRSGPGQLFPHIGHTVEYIAPHSFDPDDCAAIVDFYCAGEVIDSVSISTNMWMDVQLAYITTGLWWDGYWEGRALREPTAGEIEDLTRQIEDREGFWREPTAAEIEKLTQEIHAAAEPICVPYAGYPEWCEGRIPTSSCIYIFRYDCAGRLLHRDVRTLRAYCYRDEKGVLKIDENRWFSFTEILTPTAWGQGVRGTFDDCKQGVINSFVLPFVQRWRLDQDPVPPFDEVFQNIRDGFYLKQWGIMDMRTQNLIDAGCCIPVES